MRPVSSPEVVKTSTPERSLVGHSDELVGAHMISTISGAARPGLHLCREPGLRLLPRLIDLRNGERYGQPRYRGNHVERGVKVAISMLWYSGAELSRGLMRLAGRSPSARFVVLYYHEVPEEARTRFARQMQALSRGTTVVRAAHAGPLPDGGSYVAITFDDAFRSVRTNAVPELLSRGFPATIFVPVDCLGKKPGWEMTNGVDDQVMTCDELRSLPELIELGSHSLSHPHLTRIDAARLREEVTTSRHKLAELIGSHVSLLAFPYGEYDDRVVGTCRASRL